MARNRKASFDSTALGNSLLKDELNDGHVLGLAMLGSGNRSQDGSSVVTKTSGASGSQLAANLTGSSAMDHLDALGLHSDTDGVSISVKDGSKPLKSDIQKGQLGTIDDEDSGGSGATMASSNQRLLLEALMGVTGSTSSNSRQRDRLESWGGMSDLSVTGIGETGSLGKSGSHAAAALAASALHHTGLLADVTAAADAIDLPSVIFGSIGNSCAASVASSHSGADHPQPPGVPSKISLTSDRKYSLASLSDNSAPSNKKVDGKEVSPDIQAFVAAAMATVGDQLKELAGAVETVASGDDSIVSDNAKMEAGSVSDAGTDVQEAEPTGRPRSLSSASSTKPISVDYDAVAAAVNAAEAVSGALDLASIANMAPPLTRSGPSSSTTTRTKPKKKTHRPLPLHKKKSVKSFDASATSTTSSKPASPKSAPLHLPPVPQTSASGKDMEAIRARARAAAGYVPPSATDGVNTNTTKRTGPPPGARAPLKKRAKRLSPEPDRVSSLSAGAIGSACKRPHGAVGSANYLTPGKRALPKYPTSGSSSTPRYPNAQTPARTPSTPAYSLTTPASVSSRGQSNQKWDDMFECLVKFVEEQREIELKGASDKEKEEWEWDGNVPTTYKTKDGKALGRWINNQRSAKNKGALKEERETRLVSTGLKWSVLTTNSWSDMLNELRIYVKEKTKNGEKWDGNVPTNYRIKGNTAPDGTELDEEKNLGRWINRQRSLFQAGKLKKDRQLQLEKIGLRWSVLSTTSWETMYDALCDYAKEKREADPNNEWDGNVPANYKTNTNPAKNLGRWVNRQRSAFAKKKLKQEFVDKLNVIGLKWSVHERRSLSPFPAAVPSSAPFPASKAAATPPSKPVATPASKSAPTSPRKPVVNTASKPKAETNSGDNNAPSDEGTTKNLTTDTSEETNESSATKRQEAKKATEAGESSKEASK